MYQIASLRKYLEQNERTLKREKRFELSKQEVSRLLNEVTMPALHKIAEELKPYFSIVKARGFVNMGRILIQERRTSFLFQVRIDSTYYMSIEATTVFGTFPKGRNYQLFQERIEVENSELLTEEKIIETFNNIFINRHEITESKLREEKREPDEVT